jgi:hypothetical protein
LRNITSVSANPQRFSARLQQCACFGQIDPLADAVEQRYAHARFQRLDALGDRGLREMKLLGGARETTRGRLRRRGTEFIPFHDRSYENNEFVLSERQSYHGRP